MLKSIVIRAAVIHTYRDGLYRDTIDQVYSPKLAAECCETYNRMNNPSGQAVVEEVEILTNPPRNIDREL